MNIENKILKPSALKIRMATSSEEISVAQRLRYLVFHRELGANLSAENYALQIESDRFDSICDHLLVIREGKNESTELSVHDGSVIGTYRLLRQKIALQHEGFCSQSEFDITPLMARKPELNFLELGRSCVLKVERGTAVVELLWQGIWNYVRQHQVDVMIGCASFYGTNVDAHRDALEFLSAHNKATADWSVEAQPGRRIAIKPRAADKHDLKSVMTNLPPLIKGYLRLGCFFGNGAVIDKTFNTIDVLVILPVSQINPRYFAKFGQPTS